MRYAILFLLVFVAGCQMSEINNFEDCVNAGNPVMESYPRQCIANGQTFVEEMICTMEYAPVCGIDGNTYSNACMAGDVEIAYQGECESIGGDTDDHGCLVGAGYAWDDYVSACTRSWELDDSQKDAAKIAIMPLSYSPVTVIEVQTLKCPGCFIVTLKTESEFSIRLNSWKVEHECTQEQKAAQVCTMEYAPVCGDDGVTYGNACGACASEVEAYTIGKCPLTEAQAKDLAMEGCEGTISDFATYNHNSRTWWFEMTSHNPGCNPACVVYENGSVEVNWRCTGLITEFENCILQGGDLTESYPRQCTMNGQTFVEEMICTMEYAPVCGIDGNTYSNACMAGSVEIAYDGECKDVQTCTTQQKEAEICTMEYNPVCGDDGKTYGNACSACSGQANTYTLGECEE